MSVPADASAYTVLFTNARDRAIDRKINDATESLIQELAATTSESDNYVRVQIILECLRSLYVQEDFEDEYGMAQAAAEAMAPYLPWYGPPVART